MYNEYLELFIDEMGVPTLDPLYIATGASIKESSKNAIKVFADHIKFKYWGKTDIVFHSREIGLNLNNFSVFKSNPILRKEFIEDLKTLLKKAPIMILCCVIENSVARNRGWIQKNKFVTETAKVIFNNFAIITYCKSNTRGKISIELDEDKEESYFKSFKTLLGSGVSSTSIESSDIRDIITSISFVTKKNYDIETQLIDLFTYAVKCKYLKELKKKEYPKDSYESNIINILNGKLYKVPHNASLWKKRMLRKINPFVILPK
jgi:hypothetical protein